MEAEIPNIEQTPVQIENVNWEPLSDVRTAGTPNLEIQVEIKAPAQDSAEMEDKGTPSSHLLVLSIMVKRNVKPCLDGRGPTRSTWTWENLRVGTGIGETVEWTWVEILDFWQEIHDFAHEPTSLDIPGQTNLDEINLLEALTPGWEILCSCSNNVKVEEGPRDEGNQLKYHKKCH